VPRTRRRRRRQGREWGRRNPNPNPNPSRLEGLSERRKLPSAVRGRAAAKNEFGAF